MAVALTYVFTAFVNVRLPIAANGGLIHLGNVPLFIYGNFYSVRKQELSLVELEWDYLICCQDGQRGHHYIYYRRNHGICCWSYDREA